MNGEFLYQVVFLRNKFQKYHIRVKHSTVILPLKSFKRCLFYYFFFFHLATHSLSYQNNKIQTPTGADPPSPTPPNTTETDNHLTIFWLATKIYFNTALENGTFVWIFV